jgi:hypothetical protein
MLFKIANGRTIVIIGFDSRFTAGLPFGPMLWLLRTLTAAIAAPDASATRRFYLGTTQIFGHCSDGSWMLFVAPGQASIWQPSFLTERMLCLAPRSIRGLNGYVIVLELIGPRLRRLEGGRR